MDIADDYVLRESEEFLIPIHSDAMIDKSRLGRDAENAVFPIKSNWLQLNEEEEKKGEDGWDIGYDYEEIADEIAEVLEDAGITVIEEMGPVDPSVTV